MNSLLKPLYNAHRRFFGKLELRDPRPLAAEAPYTFYLPCPEKLAALGPGDLVKLIFASWPPSTAFNAERMWVEITARDGDSFTGTLDNEPLDLPMTRPGKKIRFKAFHIIGIEWADPSVAEGLPDDALGYWDRCIVDDGVLDGEVKVGYVYREESLGPRPGEDDHDSTKDSGWRIRGDSRGPTDAEIDARTASTVALGAVLNVDDSWLHLIDARVGSAFERDFESGAWGAVEKT